MLQQSHSLLLVELGHGCGLTGSILGSFDLPYEFHDDPILVVVV
jgi:hypothetical protein